MPSWPPDGRRRLSLRTGLLAPGPLGAEHILSRWWGYNGQVSPACRSRGLQIVPPRGKCVQLTVPTWRCRGLDGGTWGLQSWGQSRAGCTHFDYNVLVRCRALMSARFQWKSRRSLQGQGQGQHPDLSDLLIQNPTSSNEGPLFSPRSGAKPWGYSREPWHEAPFVQGLQRPVSKGIIRIL